MWRGGCEAVAGEHCRGAKVWVFGVGWGQEGTSRHHCGARVHFPSVFTSKSRLLEPFRGLNLKLRNAV